MWPLRLLWSTFPRLHGYLTYTKFEHLLQPYYTGNATTAGAFSLCLTVEKCTFFISILNTFYKKKTEVQSGSFDLPLCKTRISNSRFLISLLVAECSNPVSMVSPSLLAPSCIFTPIVLFRKINDAFLVLQCTVYIVCSSNYYCSLYHFILERC